MVNDSLYKFQKDFLKSVTDKKIVREILGEMNPIGELTPEEVIEVYRGDYEARMSEALGENFEACWFVLGDDEFFEITRKYRESFPSSYRNLNQYGEHLPDLLKESPDEDLPFLSELAQFEKDFWSLFHSPDFKVGIGQEDFDQDKLLELKVGLQDNLKCYEWDFRLLKVWDARGGEVSLDFEDIQGKQFVIMGKSDENVLFFELSQAQLHIIKELERGQSLEQALESGGDIELDANDWNIIFQVLLSFSNQILK